MRSVILLLLLATGTSTFADETRDEAKRHFLEAEKQFQLGHYAEAATEYETGYRLYPRPGFLWNLAQSYRRLGENEKALHFYRQYVVNAPPGTKAAANVAEAQEQIRILEVLVAQQQKTRVAPPDGIVGQADAERDTASRDRADTSKPQEVAVRPLDATHESTLAPRTGQSQAPRHDWYRARTAVAGFCLLGGAVAFAGVGTGLLVHGGDLDNKVNSASSIAQGEAAATSRDAYWNTSYAMIAVAGAAAIAGATLVGVTSMKRHRSLAVAVVPSSGGIAIGVGGAL